MVARGANKAGVIFAVGALAYFVAVVHRTALGVAGVEALDRFHVGATGLAALSVAQLTTYAALQIPAGKLLDRFGARSVMVTGAVLMAAAQTLMAVSTDYKLALAARVLLGAGDAPIFISACRLVAQHFPPRRAPLMVQATAVTGQAGQLATAIPVAWALHELGWRSTFMMLGGIGLAAGVALFVFVAPRPPLQPVMAGAHEQAGDRPAAGEEAAVAGGADAAAGVVSRAGVWLGFWTHFTALFSPNTIALLWGVPFFTTAQGLTKAQASGLLTVLTITKFVVGPLVGTLTARHPLRRSWISLGFAAVTAVAWVLLLSPSTPRPYWQLVLFAIAVGAGGPVSLVGVDFARTFAARDRLGAATGVANMGGFVSTILAVGLVGIMLEVSSGSSGYDLDAYRVAFASLAVPWLIGVAGIIVTRSRARRDWAMAGVVVPPLRDAIGRMRNQARGSSTTRE